ncbi:hypothetical protein [Steroidobacter denitrificans]|uniref:hypothetical protein n=1 Tax=Steroidobacter denitrificans TaxID=465721 RepID=UPI0009F84AE8|nr:hypothetical protein [Steroidobacter denitrificans]
MMIRGGRLTRMICGSGIEQEEGVELAQLQEVERRIRAALADVHALQKGRREQAHRAGPGEANGRDAIAAEGQTFSAPLSAPCELAAYEYVVQALLERAIRQTLTRTRGSRTGIANIPCFP